MNAPSLWLQLLIALVAFSLLPTILAILAKLHILPLAVYLLIADSFPEWIADHWKVCSVLLILFVADPILTWGRKLYIRWKEEQEARAYLLATAVPFYPEMEEPEAWVSSDEDMDW